MNRKTFAAAFPHTVPVLMGYLSIGVVFGWMLSAAGFAPTWAALMSATIYAGSGQYLGVDLLANASPLGDAAFLTLMINFRHLVYGLSMLEKFQGMGWRKLYMIFSLTDETYALLAGVEAPAGVDEKGFYFAIALLDHSYWIIGSALGFLLGSALSINTTGVDFAMTALFVVIAVGQWRGTKNHLPVAIGCLAKLLSLQLVGKDNMLILALAMIAALLLAAALLLVLSAGLMGESFSGAWRIWQRDRRCHASPNSAQTESACAGALGVQLAGPASYFGKRVDKPAIGDPGRPVEPEDIARANRTLYAAGGLALGAGLLARAVLGRRRA